MFPEAVRAVRETQPEAFIFENVKGLLRKSFSSYFNYILLQLQHPEIVKKENMTWEEHMSLPEKHHTAGHDDGLFLQCCFSIAECLAELRCAAIPAPCYYRRFRSDSNISWSFPNATHSQESLLYSKWVTGDYWQEHDMKKPSEMPLSTAQLRSVRRAVEETDTPLQRWQTVRDAIGDLPNPADEHGVGAYYNHEFRDGARIYAGHSGSKMDEPSKTIKLAHTAYPAAKTWLYWMMAVSATIQFEKVRGYKLSRMIISLVHPGLRV